MNISEGRGSYNNMYPESKFGEVVFDPETINQLEGYSTLKNEPFLDTGWLIWSVRDEFLIVTILEDIENSTSNPISKIIAPKSVKVSSFPSDDDRKGVSWMFEIPLAEILRIKIQSKADSVFGDFTQKYSFEIKLINNEVILIEGFYFDNAPEYWFYEHVVKISL